MGFWFWSEKESSIGTFLFSLEIWLHIISSSTITISRLAILVCWRKVTKSKALKVQKIGIMLLTKSWKVFPTHRNVIFGRLELFSTNFCTEGHLGQAKAYTNSSKILRQNVLCLTRALAKTRLTFCTGPYNSMRAPEWVGINCLLILSSTGFSTKLCYNMGKMLKTFTIKLCRISGGRLSLKIRICKKYGLI